MLITNWGYTLVEADELPMLITEEEFDALTDKRFSSDIRVESTIAAVSASIRNFCGWHLATNQLCECELNALDGRLIRANSDVIVQLPTKYLTEVIRVEINGNGIETKDFTFKTSGNLRLFDCWGIGKRDTIKVTYRSGLPTGSIRGVQELIANRVSRALSQSYGVQSESSGGVSITYNASFVAGQGAGALVDDNREVLIPYKLVEVF